MPHETDAQSISHAGFLDSLTVGVFGTVDIRWSPSGKPKPWPGRTFYRDACAHPEPLLSRQMVPKTLNLFRTALMLGYDERCGQAPAHISPSTVSSRLISELGAMPAGSVPNLHLGRLAIGRNDAQHAEKADELTLLLDITIQALIEDAGESDWRTAYQRTESLVLSSRESLPISSTRDVLALLADSLAKHNEAAAKRSGTYQLGEIVKDLVPGITSHTGEALFEYRNDQVPLLQCLKASWKEEPRTNLMLVGEGGIGKTVSMLATAAELCRNGVPAVYIPLHALPFLNTQGNFVRNYIEGAALQSSESTLDAICGPRPREASGRPSLVILLDGWNEIGERRVMGNWLTEIIQEEIESFWLSSTNAQVVIAGRTYMDSFGTWRHRWSYLKVQRLRRARIEAFLNKAKVAQPPEDHPIWKTLGNPLMLTLYACNEAQKDNCRNNPCCRFIDDHRANTQPAVIWNYLQCQINKAVLISQGPDTAMSKILAIHYAAACVGWAMVKNGVFRISRGHLATLLDEAREHFESSWKESSYVGRASSRCSAIEPAWNTAELSDALFSSVKLLIDETPLGDSDQQYDDDVTHNVGFLHQNFRDFYAALFMRNEFAPFGTLRSPEDSVAWVETAQSAEILDMLGILFDDRDLGSLWNSTEGVPAKKNSNAMFHVLGVLQRRTDLSSLSFENRDLRFVSLQDRGFSGSRVDFRGSSISNRTLLPAGHSDEVAEAIWLPGEDGRDGGYILTLGKTAILWDTRTGLPSVEFADPMQRFYTAAIANSNGLLIVLAVENCELEIYDTATQKTTRHAPRSEARVYAMTPLPEPTLIACGGEGAQAYLYDIAACETMPLLIPEDVGIDLGCRSVEQIVCSANGRKVAILYEQGGIALWRVNVKSLGSRASFEAAYDLGSEVVGLQINKEGSRLLAVTAEAEALISGQEDISNWESLDLGIEGCDAFEASFEHDLLATVSGNQLGIRTLRGGEHRKSITMATDLNSAPGAIYSMSFSPSGDRLVCIHENNIVTAWDTLPSDSGLDERPLFATENQKGALGGVRLQAKGTLLTSTGQGRFLKWDASSLRCTGDFTLERIIPDHWDSSIDGSRYYASEGSLICAYGERGSLIRARKRKNRVLDMRVDEQSGLLLILENPRNLVCLNEKTLGVVSRMGLRDCSDFAIAALGGAAVISLDEQCRLTVRRLPGLEPIGTIDVWDAMARSGDEEIRRIGAAGTEGAPYIMTPEFAQLETFEMPSKSGSYAALVVAEIAGLDEECFSLTAAIDLSEGVATMAFRDDLGDEITGVAVAPQMDRFFQSSLKGNVDSRRLSTGEYVESVEPVPNIMLVDADFRGAHFDTDTLEDMVRASGAIVGNRHQSRS